MSIWHGYTGRIILFPENPAYSSPLSANDLYKQVWGNEPDNFQKQTNPLTAAIAQGKYGDLTTSCTTHATRIDFIVSPSQPNQEDFTNTALRMIQNTNELYLCLDLIINALSGDIVPVNITRVALNLQFITLCDDFEFANELILSVIPRRFGMKIKDVEDLIFQINQTYISMHDTEIKMNAITKWSAERIQVLTFAVQSDGKQTSLAMSPLTMKPVQETFIAASVGFDINNIPAKECLTSMRQSEILKESLHYSAAKIKEYNMNVEGFLYE